MFLSGALKAPQAVLVAMHNEDGAGTSMHDMLGATGMRRNHLSTIVTHLQNRGLVERHNQYRDARRVILYLTPEGRERSGRMTAALEGFAAEPQYSGAVKGTSVT
jgi:DNA-binding MarR family transcriptional regulator